MKNKVLVKLYVPELNDSYDLFLPVNEIIWRVKRLLLKSISDLSGGAMPLSGDCMLINKDTGKIYSNNEIILNTDIRNGTEIILVTKSIKNENIIG